MASEHAPALESIDGLIQEIDSNLSRVHGTQGVIVTDQQTARIVSVLRLMRDEIASLTPEDEDDWIYDHGNPADQP